MDFDTRDREVVRRLAEASRAKQTDHEREFSQDAAERLVRDMEQDSAD
jgi:hypothetical protein